MRLDFSLESGFLRINKHTRKQICPVKLQGRKDWFSYYSLIFSYKQPLQVVVLSVYFPEAPPAAAPVLRLLFLLRLSGIQRQLILLLLPHKS